MGACIFDLSRKLKQLNHNLNTSTMEDTHKLIQVINPNSLQPKTETIAVGTMANVSHDMAWEVAQWRKSGGEVIINADSSVKLNEGDGTPKRELYITKA